MNAQVKLKTVENALDELPDDTLHTAMARAFAAIEAATKDATNPHFKSKYADLGAIIAAIKPALVANGLFFTQRCQPSNDGVTVDTYVFHRGGESMSLGTLFVPANKHDAQGFGSALTYARRYGLQTGFGVPTEDDDGHLGTKATADRPTTGETSPRKIKLEGFYDTLPKLETAAKQFARTLRGMQSAQELKTWANEPETIEFVEQCKRDLPAWWFSGRPDCPPDFIPLEIELENTKRGLKQLAELER